MTDRREFILPADDVEAAIGRGVARASTDAQLAEALERWAWKELALALRDIANWPSLGAKERLDAAEAALLALGIDPKTGERV